MTYHVPMTGTETRKTGTGQMTSVMKTIIGAKKIIGEIMTIGIGITTVKATTTTAITTTGAGKQILWMITRGD